MGKTMKRKTEKEVRKEKRRSQQRLLKRRRYSEIKNDPELLEIERNKRRMRYLQDKETKKVTSIAEKTLRDQKQQRKKWRESARKYREKKKQTEKKEIVLDTDHAKSQLVKEEDDLIPEIESTLDITSILEKSLQYITMDKIAKRKAEEEKEKKEKRLSQQRLLKRRRYIEIINDPELLEKERDKRRIRYLQNKETKKVTSIAEKPLREQKQQRKKWKEHSRNYRERKKEMEKKEIILNVVHIESQPDEIEPERESNIDSSSIFDDPLRCANLMTQAAVKKLKSAEKYRNLRLYKIIAQLKKKNEAQRKQIYRLRLKLSKYMNKIKTEPDILSKDAERTVKSNEEFDLDSLKQSPLFKNLQEFYNHDGNNAVLLLVKNDL